MSELERYGLAAVAVVIVAVLLISLNGPEPPKHVEVPFPSGPEGGATSGPELSSTNVSEPVHEVIFDPAPEGVHFDFGDEEEPMTVHSSNDPKKDPVPHHGAPLVHRVKRGDTLGSLAKKYLGSENRWREFQSVNPKLDPRRLRLGMEIKVPSGEKNDKPQGLVQSGKPTKPVPKDRTYTVRNKDTLQKISAKFYGTTKSWKKIFNANRGVLASPDSLAVGMVLSVPGT